MLCLTSAGIPQLGGGHRTPVLGKSLGSNARSGSFRCCMSPHCNGCRSGRYSHYGGPTTHPNHGASAAGPRAHRCEEPGYDHRGVLYHLSICQPHALSICHPYGQLPSDNLHSRGSVGNHRDQTAAEGSSFPDVGELAVVEVLEDGVGAARSSRYVRLRSHGAHCRESTALR